ncbi:MAG TPA: hypothetical protein VJM08_05875 [Anaerolineales bacterium]|nr:hypothetical protein [Anaerolineales bacterium]
MNPLPLFLIQFVWFLVVWSTIGLMFVNPSLRGCSPARALSVWLVPQLFRVLGVGLLVPNLAPQMPQSFAMTTAVGDCLTAFLALISLVALHKEWLYAQRLVWTCNIIGSLDLVIALVNAARVEAPRFLGAQWFVPAVLVPLMIVSHLMVFRMLLTNDEQVAGRPPR